MRYCGDVAGAPFEPLISPSLSLSLWFLNVVFSYFSFIFVFFSSVKSKISFFFFIFSPHDVYITYRDAPASSRKNALYDRNTVWEVVSITDAMRSVYAWLGTAGLFAAIGFEYEHISGSYVTYS